MSSAWITPVLSPAAGMLYKTKEVSMKKLFTLFSLLLILAALIVVPKKRFQRVRQLPAPRLFGWAVLHEYSMRIR